MQAADREIARQTALRARAVADFAATRPAASDRQQGEPGAMSADRWAARPELLRPVSEWATRELVVALSITATAAEALLHRSLTLVHRLPGTLAALEAGALHPGHLWPMLDKVAPIADDRIRAEIETELLRWAAGRIATPAQLGARARREVARRDARAAARELEESLRKRGVYWQPERVDGMGAVQALLTLPESRALVAALGAYADALTDDPDGPPRTRQQKMADCLVDLVLRPGETDLPPVQIALTMVAPVSAALGGDEPGEIDGQPVPAEVLRQLLRALGGQPLGDTEAPSPAADGAAEPPPRSPDGPGEGSEVTDVPGVSDGPEVTDGPCACCDPLDLEWFLFEQREALLAEAEMRRRILAGELDDPGPTTRADLEAWLVTALPPEDEADWSFDEVDSEPEAGPSMTGPRGHDGDMDRDMARDEDRDQDRDAPSSLAPDESPPTSLTPVESPPTSLAPDESPPTSLAPDESPPTSLTPVESPPTSLAPAGSPPSEPRPHRWWVDADEAVEEASQALRGLDQAMGRAHRLVHTAAVADEADEASWRAGPGGRVTAAEETLAALAAATAARRAELGALLDLSGGGGLLERPRIALTDAVTGALRALTDLPGLRASAHCGAPACRRRPEACPHDLTGRPALGPPGPTAGYRPGAELDRWVRARDRRCRFPGCRRRVPIGGELDHDRPHPDGPTSAANLAGYCTTDHRGKHQAPGWRHELHADGSLTVTTPTGLVAATTPPPY